MFFRIRVAFALALVASLFISITAFAKGEFSFISITGPNLKEEVRSTDPALTTDFLAFFDFAQVKAEAPANPGVGYLVTRYYVDGKHESAFDQLHYYPDTGFVYYDGIVNGWSEYDDKWYTARPAIKAAFESVLPGYAQSAAPAARSQPIPSLDQTQSIMLVAVIAGLAVGLALVLWFRRPFTR